MLDVACAGAESVRWSVRRLDGAEHSNGQIGPGRPDLIVDFRVGSVALRERGDQRILDELAI